jgi:hypothetical protein
MTSPRSAGILFPKTDSPTTQDYLIAVRAEGGTGADYTLEITIPPL